MKTYYISIDIDDNNSIGVHEKTSGPFSLSEIRLVVSAIEELKARLVHDINSHTKEYDIKNLKEQ